MGKQLININVPPNVSKPLPYESKVEFDSKPVLLDECFALPPSEPPLPDVPPTFTEVKKILFKKPVSSVEKVFLLPKTSENEH